jgi:hypothetical protein
MRKIRFNIGARVVAINLVGILCVLSHLGTTYVAGSFETRQAIGPQALQRLKAPLKLSNFPPRDM